MVGLVKRVGEMCIQFDTLPDFIDGRVPVEDSLSSPIICMVEARQQDLKIRVSRDIDAESLAYDTTVEALDHTVCGV